MNISGYSPYSVITKTGVLKASSAVSPHASHPVDRHQAEPAFPPLRMPGQHQPVQDDEYRGGRHDDEPALDRRRGSLNAITVGNGHRHGEQQMPEHVEPVPDVSLVDRLHGCSMA